MKAEVLEELRLSTGIVLGGDEVVPRFRIFGHMQSYTVMVPLPDAIMERQRRMQLLYGFMAWQGATGFIMSTELVEPDAVTSVGVNFNDVVVAARPILRKPLTVGAVEWLSRSLVGDEVIALLPRGKVVLEAAQVKELKAAFGVGGEFEARPMN